MQAEGQSIVSSIRTPLTKSSSSKRSKKITERTHNLIDLISINGERIKYNSS